MNASDTNRARMAWFLVKSLFLSAAVGIFGCAGDTNAPGPATNDRNAASPVAGRVVDSSKNFGFDVYQKLAADPAASGKNLVFSPISISNSFAMLLEGARGETARQLAAVFHFPTGKNPGEESGALAFRENMRWLRGQFAESTAAGGFQLFSASGLWIDRRFSPRAAFIKTLEENYGVQGPHTLDFRNGGLAARYVINAWSEIQTLGKIREILATDPDPNTAMVLANTVYFEARWFHPFNRSATRAEPFHLDSHPAHDVSVSMMNGMTGDDNPYFENEDLQMTVLDYGSWKVEGDNVEKNIPAYMLLVLPRHIDELAALERSLTWQKLENYAARFDKLAVHVQLPRFKMSGEIDLKQMIEGLGATNVFDSASADLSGIAAPSAGGPLYVNWATHRAVIDVDEEETKAAAETAASVGKGGTGGTPVRTATFRADHPFLFYIIHKKTNAILFLGRVMKPEESTLPVEGN